MEYTIYYENTVPERPKQLNIGGNGKSCCIAVCKIDSMAKIGRRRR